MMTLKEQRKEILEEFDFEHVADVMFLLGWEWQDKGVPTPKQLRKVAKRLLKEVESDPSVYRVGTGGFMVYNRLGQLYLAFEITHWEVENDEYEPESYEPACCD